MSFRQRMILGVTILIVFGVCSVVYFVQGSLRSRYKEVVEVSLVDIAQLMAASLSSQSSQTNIPIQLIKESFELTRQQPLKATIFGIQKRDFAVNVYVTDSTGSVLFDSADPGNVGKDYSQWNDVYLTLQGKYGVRSTRVDPEDQFSSIMYVAAPIRVGGQIIGVVSVSSPSRSLEPFLANAQKALIFTILAIGLVLILMGVAFSYGVTIPINRLMDYANKSRLGKRQPLPKFNSPEFQQLADAFEQMRISIEGKREIERYVQSLTHEIKSPVTAIQGSAELCLEDPPEEQKRKFLENILSESKRITRLVERLLQIAALESRASLAKRESLGVHQLICEVLEAIQPIAEQRKVTLSYTPCSASLTVRGERLLLSQSFRNLVQNALDFSPEGSNIQVRVQSGKQNLAISVEDEGAGIPDFALEKIYDRFFSIERPQDGKKSSGLGLSFVKEVATLHRGHISITNKRTSKDGHGVEATLTLPR